MRHGTGYFLWKATAGVLALFVLAPSIAGADGGGKLGDAIERAIKKACVKPDHSAVCVISLPEGKPVYTLNASTPLIPASVQKLTTTAAALHYLGPDYRFKTGIYHTGERLDDVINGDIIIRGGGDPKLTPEQVWLIARRIRWMGIKEVTGDLVVDETFFDQLSYAPAWSKNRTQRAYDARLGALSVNFNTVGVHVFPGSKQGDPLIATIFPDSDYFRLVNKAITKNRGKNRVTAWRSNGGRKTTVVVEGSMKPGSMGRVIYLNVDNPPLYAGETFRKYFADAGIAIRGGIRTGVAGDDATLIYVHESEQLSAIIRGLNKYSNNFTAEQIAKTMAAEVSGQPGSHHTAIGLINRFLIESGIDLAGVVIVDGSGLSRKNRTTAATVANLLKVMRRRFNVGPDFVASLGVMGVDGSVEKRMKTSPAKSLARAKTGTLARISSLAGYVKGAGGGLYAFAIILNDNGCRYDEADKIEDSIVTSIYKFADIK